MPELDIQPMPYCSSWENFRIEVKGSQDEPYIVAHEHLRGTGDSLYGFTCTCPAFKYREGECKHIEAVKGEACLWHGQHDEVQAEKRECPRCGGGVKFVMCAV